MPDIAEPVRSIFKDRRDVNVLMAEVESIDVQQQRIMLKDAVPVAYDYLVIGLGMVNAYFGHNQWAQHSIGLKSLDEARRILGSYAEASSSKATEDLKHLGVEVLTNAAVKDVRAGLVELDGQTIEAESIIWTAGVEANPVLRSIPSEFDRRGRISVEQDTSLPGFPEVFVIGDVANLTDVKGKQVPGVSPAAMQMGRHAAKIIQQELQQYRKIPVNERKPFTYLDKGSMATIGRSKAVAQVGGLKFSGPFTWVLWLVVHLIFLVGFRNKAAVLLQWAYAYIGYRPGARVFDLPNATPAEELKATVDVKF